MRFITVAALLAFALGVTAGPVDNSAELAKRCIGGRAEGESLDAFEKR